MVSGEAAATNCIAAGAMWNSNLVFDRGTLFGLQSGGPH